MKKYLMMGVAALAFASCSNKDVFDEDLVNEIKQNEIVEKYNKAFIRVFGEPAANQTWGFGTVGTRAAVYWADNHNHVDGCTDWEGELDFTLPDDAVQINTEDNIAKKWDGSIDYTWDGKTYYKIPAGNVLYISDKFEGDLILSEGFNSDVTIYNYGKVTNISLNYVNGTITYYNAGTLSFNLSSGNHIFYNGADGELTLNKYDNVGHVYNNGELYLANSDLRNDLTVHSAGLGIVYFPNGAASGDGLQSTLDIHGKTVVNGDMKIGNDKTQYVCGLEISGTLNLTKGHLQTSYVKANEITFDGDRLYLLPAAHVVANTIRMPNSDTYVYASEGSNALIEVTDMDIQNQNFFDKVFSDNIYFKIGGTIKFTNSSVWDGTWTAAEYVTETEDGKKVAERLNAGNAIGSPACGLPWTVGTPDEGGNDDGDDWTFVVRIFAEDLSATSESDFDFNDVVFDVYNHAKDKTKAKVVLRAAGGTLPLTVAGKEVHEAFAEVNPDKTITTSTMINTRTSGSIEASVCPEIELTGNYTDETAKDIVIAVDKADIKDIEANWIELKAEMGAPAAKFAVNDQTVEWCDERQDITKRYENFVDWVQNATPEVWWK